MKLAFLVYHDVLDAQITAVLDRLNIDYYTKWENVKGKGHQTDPHLGTRTFPGYNYVRLIAIEDDSLVNPLAEEIKKINSLALRNDDKVRLFLTPLEMII